MFVFETMLEIFSLLTEKKFVPFFTRRVYFFSYHARDVYLHLYF